MKRICILTLLIAISVAFTACNTAPKGLDPESKTYQLIQEAIYGSEYTASPTPSNIQSFASALERDPSSFNYEEYARHPYDHEYEYIIFDGVVKNVLGILGWDYIVAVNGDETDLMQVAYSSEVLLVGDRVRVSGLFRGSESVDVNGEHLFLPYCAAKDVQLVS